MGHDLARQCETADLEAAMALVDGLGAFKVGRRRG
jgi:hypothetical protein